MTVKEVMENPLITGKDEIVTPPTDLINEINKLKMVQRYVQDDYPAGEIPDNTYSHELRCAKIAKGLKRKHPDNSDFDFVKLDRILWLHDLGELNMIHDVTSVIQARDSQIAQQKNVDEEKILNSLLTKNDSKLMEEMESAGRSIKGKSNWDNVSTEALVAYVIDKTDSNMYFHYWVTQSTQTFPSDSLIYTFIQYHKFMTALETCPLTYAKTMCQELLNEQVIYVAKTWKLIPKDRVPKEIINELKSF